MWLATVATETAGETPRKISNGVIRNPPPMPNIPEMKPTANPIARMTKTLTGRSAMGRKICTVDPSVRGVSSFPQDGLGASPEGWSGTGFAGRGPKYRSD